MGLKEELAGIEKEYGDGAVRKLGEVSGMDIEVIPSGNIALDVALGVGGYPKGRIIEIYGPESAGKTTTALHAVAEAQKLGGVCAFVDAEHALDPVYAASIGVDVDELYISQPDCGEDALDIVLRMASSGEVAMIVVDSVAALTPRAEINGDMGDSHVGLQARLMSQAMRKLNAVIYNTGTVLIFINQIREKIGVMFGSPETTPGGRALKFYASVRLDVRRKEQIKETVDKAVEIKGNKTTIKVVKNKVAPPFKVAELDIMYGEGMSQEGSILDLGVSIGLIKKSGAWYYDPNGEQIGQGREKAKLALKDNVELRDQLYEACMSSLFGGSDE